MPLASKTFADIITFTRGSTGSYFDSSAVLQSAAINVPRFDYDPATSLPRGILIEGAVTNRIRNNTMVGAVAGTPGTLPTNWATFTALTGLTREVVGTGTESGINYIDIRLSGTPSAAGQYILYPEAANSAAAALSQTWTNSSYVKLAAGTLAGITSAFIGTIEYNATPAFLGGTYVAITPTGSALATQRVFATRTLNQPTVAFVSSQVGFNLDGAAIDFTIRIGMPQLEAFAFATSVIPTSTVAVTRSADVASVNTLSPWVNETQGTMYVQFSLASLGHTASRTAATLGVSGVISRGVIANVNDSTTDATTFLIYNDALAFQGISTPVVTTTVNTTMKAAGAFKVNDSAMSINNAVPVTDNTVTLATGLNVLRIGAAPTGANLLYGWIQRIQFYPARLTNTDLQALTV